MIRTLMWRLLPVVLGIAVCMTAAATPAAAQATGNVRGSVVDATTQRPLSGAQVVIEGTGRGGLSNAGGQFLLLNVPVGTHTLRVEMLGFASATQEITVQSGQAERIVVGLRPVAIAMDELVVTGTAGAVSKRTLGNAVTKLDAGQITEKTTITNLSELLQAKTPGVQILPNSGVTGVASDIRIRGAGSLTGAQPVVFVDGVRYSIDDLGTFTPSGAGVTSFSGQRTSAFDFINPNDIESIEVIKGPAAATLYGAEAANGVIQIITKKGRRGEQNMQWTVKLEQAQNEWSLDIPDNYTTCTAARIAETTGGEPTWPGCQGVAEGTVIRGNPLREDPLALRNGSVQRATLSLRGGGERYSFYFAGDFNDENGVFYNNYNKRKSVRGNFSLSPNDKVDVTVTTAYTEGDLRLPVGDEAAQGMLLSAFRGRPGRVTADPLNAGWAINRAEQANEYNNTTRSDRLTFGTTLNVTPFRWFRNRMTLGMDYYSSLAQILSPAGSVDADFAGIREGSIAQRVPRSYTYSVDYAGSIDRELTAELQSTTSFGMQAVSKRYETLYAFGGGLGAPDVTLIGNAQTTVGSNSFSENKSLGFFVQEQIGWKNRLFLTGALRADDNSSFGRNFDWIYYPKGQIAWMLSEEPMLQGVLEPLQVGDLKFRAAYGHAGQAPAPFAANQTFTIDKVIQADGSVASALRTRSLGNQDLKAERGEEYEIGFDAGLLNDRVGIDFTYYNKRMRDVIIAQGAAGSTGFGGTFYGSTLSVLKNLGETLNTGIELGLDASPLRTRNFAWDARVTVATNDNELVDFGDDRTSEGISGQSYAPGLQVHKKGYPLGGFWDRVPQRNADGSLVLNDRGAVVLEDTTSFLGTAVPTREIAFSNTFTLLRDFSVFVLLDYKGGHHTFNYKEFARCNISTQLNCERINRAGAEDDPNFPLWKTRSTYIEKADFLKLRDVSLTYAIPGQWARYFRANAASVTLAGHNLGLWSDYSGMDPEVNGYGNRNFARADVYPVPMLRRLSMSLNVSF